MNDNELKTIKEWLPKVGIRTITQLFKFMGYNNIFTKNELLNKLNEFQIQNIIWVD